MAGMARITAFTKALFHVATKVTVYYQNPAYCNPNT
jgi:hypothetical protein